MRLTKRGHRKLRPRIKDQKQGRDCQPLWAPLLAAIGPCMSGIAALILAFVQARLY